MNTKKDPCSEICYGIKWLAIGFVTAIIFWAVVGSLGGCSETPMNVMVPIPSTPTEWADTEYLVLALEDGQTLYRFNAWWYENGEAMKMLSSQYCIYGWTPETLTFMVLVIDNPTDAGSLEFGLIDDIVNGRPLPWEELEWACGDSVSTVDADSLDIKSFEFVIDERIIR